MDSVFQLSDGDRANYLFNLMHSFCCSYICLWRYSLDHNFLYCEDGYYHEETPTQVGAPSSSSGSLGRRLFEDYKSSIFTIENDLVPGVAFKQRSVYLELHQLDLQRLASIPPQREFYKEARIKIAVFLGCERGEIELGMSQNPQMNLEMKMQTLFPQDFARQKQQSSSIIARITDQNRPSPSSSFSMDSTDSSSLLYNIPSSSVYLQEQLHNIPLRTLDTTDAALTRAYLAILSSSTNPPPVSSGKQPSTTLPHGYQRTSAFRRYSGGNLVPRASEMRSNLRRQTMFKRAIAYFRGLNYRRLQEQASLPIESARPTSTQLHHMISERRRREKINESFQALRSLLPQGTKKDKASVLRATKEYLSSLQAQLDSLSKRNQLLEAQLSSRKEIILITPEQVERLDVSIMPVSESNSRGERMVDLQVTVRGEHPTTDLIIRVLEFLNKVREASLVSMESAQVLHQEGANRSPSNRMIFRLRIEGTEWDESTFKEAVKRILADFAH